MSCIKGRSTAPAFEQKTHHELEKNGIEYESGVTCVPFHLDLCIRDSGVWMIVEIDQDQHKGKHYTSDGERMISANKTLFEEMKAMRGNIPLLPIVWVRFCPDGLYGAGKHGKRRDDTTTRLERLIRCIKRIQEKPPRKTAKVCVMYMYYDSTEVNGNDVPNVYANYDDKTKKGCILLQPTS